MQINVFEGAQLTGKNAADKGAALLRQAIDKRGKAFVILATGASQFEMLKALIEKDDIDWARCTIFHLDEYVGIDETHKASFVRYLRERFLAHVPAVKQFVAINGNSGSIKGEIARINKMISAVNIDVAFVGIGENSHLAFNDPPADFDTKDPYIVVDLDHECRLQQKNEGWFKTLADVPEQAISMSISQIMKSRAIICTVPDLRKARAAKCAIEGPVSNLCPASILQEHKASFLFLDQDAASLLAARQD
ncbi:Glucosamine-6-phosphate deaminase [hydrothermal vent metagenome]|uniref:Glucosamine-6-phosphate deaminase n=1 Tax=hydrothermal vent metagenome TaxID=652676 RepID=A0A3B0UMB4_9ZZZZ